MLCLMRKWYGNCWAEKQEENSDIFEVKNMISIYKYKSPLGWMTMAGEKTALTGLWFDEQKYFGSTLPETYEEKKLAVFDRTAQWLDLYFSGKIPDFTPPIYMKGSEFQKEVWSILLCIPYGTTTTYKAIAEKIAEKRGIARMSAQAVGGAVGDVYKRQDVMIGNEEDFTACLGFEVEGNDAELKQLNLDGYKKMINEAARAYPNFKAVATTLREVKTATVNDWSAICWADGEIYKAKDYKGLEILDRVGGGDSFASGLIYGLMTTQNAETAVNYGAAHGALAMTTPGDTTMADKREVEAVMGGKGARVQR